MKIVFAFASGADPDEMLNDVAFQLAMYTFMGGLKRIIPRIRNYVFCGRGMSAQHRNVYVLRGEGARNIKTGRDVPIRSLDPEPFPDTIGTPSRQKIDEIIYTPIIHRKTINAQLTSIES